MFGLEEKKRGISADFSALPIKDLLPEFSVLRRN